jgi:hypothetical protein
MQVGKWGWCIKWSFTIQMSHVKKIVMNLTIEAKIRNSKGGNTKYIQKLWQVFCKAAAWEWKQHEGKTSGLSATNCEQRKCTKFDLGSFYCHRVLQLYSKSVWGGLAVELNDSDLVRYRNLESVGFNFRHRPTFTLNYRFLSGRDTSVGLVTSYLLVGPGFASRWRRDFSHPSRPALVPNPLPTTWAPVLFIRVNLSGIWCWPPSLI